VSGNIADISYGGKEVDLERNMDQLHGGHIIVTRMNFDEVFVEKPMLVDLGLDLSFLIITCELCWLILLICYIIFYQAITKLCVHEDHKNTRHNLGKRPIEGKTQLKSLPSINFFETL